MPKSMRHSIMLFRVFSYTLTIEELIRIRVDYLKDVRTDATFNSLQVTDRGKPNFHDVIHKQGSLGGQVGPETRLPVRGAG